MAIYIVESPGKTLYYEDKDTAYTMYAIIESDWTSVRLWSVDLQTMLSTLSNNRDVLKKAELIKEAW